MARKKLLLLLLFFLPLLAQAQEERTVIPVNWEQIRQTVTDNPDSVKALVSRLTRNELDTTLTMNERILAYCGQSYLSKGGEMLDVMHMNDSAKAESTAALALADKVLAVNPLNTEALITKTGILFDKIKSNPADSATLIPQARYCLRLAMRLFNTIASTGLGTAEKPFYVTSVDDEYNFIRYYLRIWKINGQALIRDSKDQGPRDLIYLGEQSEYWKEPKIYFEITRVLQLEKSSLNIK